MCTVRDEDFKDYLERFHEMIVAAIKYWRPNFICLNELSFPNLDEKQINQDDPLRKSLKLLQGKLRRQLTRLAKDNQVYIIAGSYHDQKSYFNTAPIFHCHQVDSIHNPYLHNKLVSAAALQEYILTPSLRKVTYYSTPYGNFSVLICLDSYDASIIFSLLSNNIRRTDSKRGPTSDHIKIVFVPSLNPDNQALAICENLSFAAATIVAFSNCGPRRKKDRMAVFVAGKRWKPEPVPELKMYQDNLQCFSIPREGVKGTEMLIRGIEKEYTQEFKYILGLQGAIVHG